MYFYDSPSDYSLGSKCSASFPFWSTELLLAGWERCYAGDVVVSRVFGLDMDYAAGLSEGAQREIS